MNQINPLHIGILLIIVLIFGTFSLESAKEELQIAKVSFEETKELAVELSEFKSIYADSNKITKSLNRILGLAAVKSANIEVKKTKHGMILSSKSMNKKALNSLMGKLLNGSYNINTMRIKKLSNEKVSLYMEIKW